MTCRQYSAPALRRGLRPPAPPHPAKVAGVADWVQDGPVGHDLSRFRFMRFSNGPKTAPGPSP